MIKQAIIGATSSSSTLAAGFEKDERIDPSLHANGENLRQHHIERIGRTIVHQFRHSTLTDSTDIAYLVTDRIQQRLVPLEYFSLTTHPQREPSSLCSPRSAADRRIQHVRTFVRKRRINLLHHRSRIC